MDTMTNGRDGRHVIRVGAHTVRAYDGTRIDTRYCRCSCGWRGPRRIGEADAADVFGILHARRAAADDEAKADRDGGAR